MYNSARMIGVTIGIIVGLILTIFVIRYVNRNKKLTTEYDEMQKQIRGEGYKYAFYAALRFLLVSPCRPAIASGGEHISGRIQICRGM